MYKLKIIIITLFPKIFKEFFKNGLLGKCIKNKILKIKLLNLKNFSKNKIDNYSYGGNGGMVISCEPIFNAIKKAKKISKNFTKIIYFSPQGKILNQNYIKKIIDYKSIILLCGRYEGIDERIIKEYIDEELSIGNFILSGGEVAAMVLIDCVYRLIPGVIKNINNINNESFSNGLLDYPHYTRPYNFMNIKVPKILLSGNHLKIFEWRLKQSLGRTWEKRPDLIKKIKLNLKEKKLLNEFKIEYNILKKKKK